MSNITMTNVDPGEGSTLASDEYLAVYGQTNLLDLFYPVGSYYETSNVDFNPNTSWGGIWVEDTNGRATVAYQSDNTAFNQVGKLGGEQTHILTRAEMPNIDGWIDMHGSGASGTVLASSGGDFVSTGSLGQFRSAPLDSGASSIRGFRLNVGQNQAHNNLQPYVVVKRWHRIQ